MAMRLPVRALDEASALQGAGDDQSQPTAAQAGTSEQFRTAIAAARKLLADTVDAVHPRTPARELFAYVTQYRARLAELVAACPAPGSGDGA